MLRLPFPFLSIVEECLLLLWSAHTSAIALVGERAMYYKVEISGVDTSKLKTLKNDETNELLRRAHAGDREARNRLVESNLKLVLSAVQRFSNRGGQPR